MMRSVCLVNILALAHSTGAAAQPMTEPARLEPGRTGSREIAKGERHAYRLALEANQAVHVVAVQLGADVILALTGMDGKPIAEMDTPTGGQGAESMWFVT